MGLSSEEYLAPGDRLPLRFKKGVKQPFFDWMLVEPGYGLPFWQEYQKQYGFSPWLTPRGVALRTYRPKLGPAIAAAEPTGVVGGYSTLIFHGGVYRLYHETYGRDHRGDLGALLCVLESADGISWTRPNLGLIEYRGNTDNNIVFGCGIRATGGGFGGHGATVFADHDAPEDERFKLVFMGPSAEDATLAAWLWGAVSGDGYRWNLLPEPILKTLSDTQNVCGRVEGRYKLFTRGWSPQGPAGGGGKRIVRLAESEDFRNFPHPVDILRVPSRWGPWRDIYTSAWQRWPGSEAELMLPTVYDRDTDTTSILFAASRDGVHFDFPEDAPLLGGGDSPELQTMYAGVGVASLSPGVWSFPVHASPKAHNEYAYKPRSLHLATIREDGFSGIEADLEGSFSLFPAFYEGAHLAINGWTRHGGSIRARLLTLDGEGGVQAVEGFDYCDMAPLEGDCLYKRVAWRGGSLEKFEGRPLRLELTLIRARIFALRVE